MLCHNVLKSCTKLGIGLFKDWNRQRVKGTFYTRFYGNFYEYKLLLMDDTQCARPKNYTFKMSMLSQPESYCCLNKGRLYHILSLFACQTRRLLHPVSFINYCPNYYVWPIHNYNNETIVKHGQISELALSAYIILTWLASCKDWVKESPTNHPLLQPFRWCNEMVLGSNYGICYGLCEC
jgi:hypothetical protein